MREPIGHPTGEDRRWRRRRANRSTRGLARRAFTSRRINELEAIYSRMFGATLPDTKQGRQLAADVLHHIAQPVFDGRGRQIDPRPSMRRWLATWAPWLDLEDDDTATMLERILVKPLRFRADTLAKHNGLTAADRAAWHITTVGSVDKPKEQRAAERRERARQRKEAIRRASGARARASSASRSKPWIAEGIHRRTWERRRKRAAERLQHREGC